MITSKCNLCGKSLDEFDLVNDFTFDRIVGYGSTHDGERVSAKFCCECFDKIVDGIEANGHFPLCEDFDAI